MFFKGRIWRVKPSSYRYKTVLPKVKSQHTTCWRGHCWYLRGLPARLTEGRGNCAFPSVSLTRRGAGVSHVFVATFTKSDCFVCRLRRCKTAAVPEDLLSRVNVLSGRLAQLFFLQAVTSWLPQVSHQLFIGEPRGPRATWRVAAGAPHSLSSRSASAGTAAVLHRLRRPSREQLCLQSRFIESTVTQLRSRRVSKAFGWMPHRPPASAPVGKCLVPSGRAFQETVLSDGEGAINPRGKLLNSLPWRGLRQPHSVRIHPSKCVGHR